MCNAQCVCVCVCVLQLENSQLSLSRLAVLGSLCVGVVVEPQVPQPLSVRPGQSSCGLLALPKEELPVQGSSS